MVTVVEMKALVRWQLAHKSLDGVARRILSERCPTPRNRILVESEGKATNAVRIVV
jgi:hypothetical protein